MHTQQLLSAVAPLSRGLCFLMPSQCADYEAVALWKSGTRILWPRVVGVAVEKAFKVADASHGVGALGPDDLGGFVLFNYVKWRGDVEVGLKAFDAPLAVEAAQRITTTMTRLGFARVGPSDTPVRDRHGRFVYDECGSQLFHDLVYERPPAAGVWSAEIRCANAHAYQGLVAARANQQRSAQAFWSTAQRAGARSSWNGRILILVWLQDNRKAIDVRCDVYTDDLGWRPLFGWPGAPVSMRAITPSAQPATLPPAPRAAPKAALRPRRGAVARRPQKRPWAEVESTFFFPAGHKLYALCPRAKVARLTDVFAQLTKDKCHIGEKLSSWFGGGRLGHLEGRDYGKGPSSANGGKKTWVATQRTCEKVWSML